MTIDHVIWLAKLDSEQVKIVEQMIKDLWKDSYWDGVNKHSVRALLESWANKIDAAKT